MQIDVITLFPDIIISSLNYSIIGRAIAKQQAIVTTTNLRDFGIGNYHAVDGKPYGGGTGMILRVDVMAKAIEAAKQKFSKVPIVILLDAKGKRFVQSEARRLSTITDIIFVCGHYEGIDERIKTLVDETISLGEFIMTGSEPAAVAIIDAIIRLIPTVLSKENVTTHESYELIDEQGNLLLEYPQYTKPRIFNNISVPDILVGGNHKKIFEWGKQNAQLSSTITENCQKDSAL